jgi:hypothetical protein
MNIRKVVPFLCVLLVFLAVLLFADGIVGPANGEPIEPQGASLFCLFKQPDMPFGCGLLRTVDAELAVVCYTVPGQSVDCLPLAVDGTAVGE